MLSDLDIYLRWISRMTFLGWVGVLASITTGVLILTGVIPGGVIAIVAGIAAGAALVTSIKLLLNMSNRADEIECSIRDGVL